MPWKECSLLPKCHGLSPNDSVKAKWILFTDAHSIGGVHFLLVPDSSGHLMINYSHSSAIYFPEHTKTNCLGQVCSHIYVCQSKR